MGSPPNNSGPTDPGPSGSGAARASSALGAGGPSAEHAQRALERRKELDHRHRNRVRVAGATRALGLPFLRRFLRGWFTRPVVVAAPPIAHPPAETLALSWIGHATLQIVSQQARLLTDPVLTSALAGLRRTVAPAIHEADLADVSAVLISHAHGDRLHAPSLRRLPRALPIVVPDGCGEDVRRLGFTEVTALSPGDSIVHRDLRITAVPARHDGNLVPGVGTRGCNGYLIQEPGVAVYFAGATGYFSGFLDIGERLRPDVALLPISGYEPDALRDGNLSPLDAIFAFQDLRARLLVPFAYGTFPLGYEPPGEPVSWLRELAREYQVSDRVAVLGPGEPLRVNRRS